MNISSASLQFTLRKAVPGDLDFIMTVEEKGFIKEIQEDREVFRQRIETCPELFLIFEDSVSHKKAGYLSAEFLEKMPETAEELKLGHLPKKIETLENLILYISSFSILPEFRGNGNGKKLWQLSLEYFKSLYKDKLTFVLIVNELWKGALHIYKESGFSEISVFKDFFPCSDGSTSNAIFMKL